MRPGIIRADYSEDNLRQTVEKSTNYSDVMRGLGIDPNGGNHRTLKQKLRVLGISTDHFTRSWNKGQTAQTNLSLASAAAKLTTADDVIFCENSTASSTLLRRRFLKSVRYACNICGLETWQGRRVSLHVDHINGTHNDNRLENLRLLCPNCHQQTDTWGSKTPNNQVVQVKAQEAQPILKPEKTCLDCKTIISAKADRCKSCATKHRQPTKIVWPELDDLISEIQTTSFLAVAKRLGVWRHAVVSHLEARGVDYKSVKSGAKTGPKSKNH